jgi:cytochrome c556
MMIRIALVAAAIAIGATAVAAQGNVIAERQALMKRSGEQARIGTRMVRGEAPYDQATAEAVLANFADKAAKLPTLFPESSRTGESRALQGIWDKSAEFNAAIVKFTADVKAAQALTKDLDSFKAAFSNVSKDCGTCHETFRRPQQR